MPRWPMGHGLVVLHDPVSWSQKASFCLDGLFKIRQMYADYIFASDAFIGVLCHSSHYRPPQLEQTGSPRAN